MKNFQTQLNLVNNNLLLRQLLSRSSIGAIEGHVEPRNSVIEFDPIPLGVDVFQRFRAKSGPAVVKPKVLQKQTAIVGT